MQEFFNRLALHGLIAVGGLFTIFGSAALIAWLCGVRTNEPNEAEKEVKQRKAA